MKLQFIFLWVFLSSAVSYGQTPPVFEIQGKVLERGTKKALPSVNVFVLPSKQKFVTDEKGNFTGTIQGDREVDIVINVSGYIKYEQKIILDQKKEWTFFVERESYNVFETTVSDLRSKKDNAQKRLSQKEFLQTPGSNGDPVKAVQNLPGVSRTRGGDSRVVIQGAEPEDTRYNIEGHDVPLVFHFGGISSIITPEAVESVDYLSAGYGPEFGRALGGHVGLKVRKPKADRRQGMVFMDIYNIGGLVEGGHGEDSSYLVSGRYSYVGEVFKKIAEKMDNLSLTVAPVFLDFNGQYHRKINDDEDFRIFSIFSKDSAELILKKPPGNDPRLRGSFQQNTDFFRIIPQWTRKIDSSSQVSASLGLGTNKILADVASNYFKLDSQNLTVRADYEKKQTTLWTYNIGADNTYTWYNVRAKIPATFTEGGVNNPLSSGETRDADVSGKSNIIGVYFRNELKTSEDSRWTYLPNLRVDRYSLLSEIQMQPRLALRYLWDDSLVLRGAVGLYTQSPAEQAVDKTYGNPELLSRKASHYMLGFEKDFRAGSSEGLSLNGALFYKNLWDQPVPSAKLVVREGALTPENYASSGTGRIYGFEIQSKLKLENWNWVGSYTYLQSRRQQPGQAEVPSQYDQTHSLNLLAGYEFKSWRYGGRLRYVTGNPFTPVVGGILDSDNDVYLPVRGEIYSQRNDAFFQVDFRVDRQWIYDTWVLSAYLDIQNLTNSKNQEGLTYAYDYSQSEKITGLPLLPTIGVKGEF